MNEPPVRPPVIAQDELGHALKWSVIAHAGIIVFILVKSLVFPGKPVVYIPTLRVDIVGLPDVLKSDLNRIPKAPPGTAEEAEPKAEPQEPEAPAKKVALPKAPKVVPKAEVAEPDEMVLKPKAHSAQDERRREKKLKAALSRIKALAKISKEESSDSAGSAQGVLIKGNKISRGTSLTGEARESAEASYFDQVRDRLQENWALPVWLARQNYSAQVELFINRKGNIRAFKFSKFSGNAQFDDAVKRAIKESQPFPTPPPNIAMSIELNGISVGFPL